MKCPNCSFDNPNNLGICKVCGETIHDAAPESVRDTVSLDFALQERFRKRAMRAREQKEMEAQSAPSVESPVPRPTEAIARQEAPSPQKPDAAPAAEPKREATWSQNIQPAKDFAASRRAETQARRQTEIRLKPDLNAQPQPQARRQGKADYRPAPTGFNELPVDDQTPPSAGWEPLSKNDPYYTVPLNSMLSESRPSVQTPPVAPTPTRAIPPSAIPNTASKSKPAATSSFATSDEFNTGRQASLARDVEALEEAFPPRSRDERSTRSRKPKNNRMATLIIILLILVLAGLLFLIYKMSTGRTAPPAPTTDVANTTAPTQSMTQPSTQPTQPSTTPTQPATTKPKNPKPTTQPSNTQPTSGTDTTAPTSEKPLSNFSSSATSSGGSPASDLTIDSLRVGSHEDFTRVVIDLDPAKTVPSYQANISEDGRTVTLVIRGVIKNNATDVTTPVGRINSVVISQTTPDSVTAVIQLNNRMQYRVFGLESPVRIVLDVANL
ncbi:MAG: hypothetical protein Q4A52_00855 [Bacillota bacterium]|nr:hypothetical protein [Bacillota bacterium]